MNVFMKLFTVPQYSYESLMMLCHQFNAWNSQLHFFTANSLLVYSQSSKPVNEWKLLIYPTAVDRHYWPLASHPLAPQNRNQQLPNQALKLWEQIFPVTFTNQDFIHLVLLHFHLHSSRFELEKYFFLIFHRQFFSTFGSLNRYFICFLMHYDSLPHSFFTYFQPIIRQRRW